LLNASAILIALSLLSLPVAAGGNSHPHYAFSLPNGYVGWIQVIFNDPRANQLLWERTSYLIDVPDSGIARTSDLRVDDSAAVDTFFYRVQLSNGQTDLVPVPNGYVLPGFAHGGFGYMNTGGKGPGYSWFLFIGPPEMRAKVPMADWHKVVKEYRRTHSGNSRVELDCPLPVPGRMALLPHDPNSPRP
jgi:hypothetical protein